jgi:ATP-dependent DNA helicase RecQ
MLALCETVHCRRSQLLTYFGQEPGPGACGNCDTCLTPPETWDGTVAAQKALSAVVRLQRERRQKFGAGQIIDILLGRRTAKVIQFDHDQLSVFGIGEDLVEAEWRGVIRQLLAQGLLAVEGEYGTLVLTETSATVLRREREVPLRKEAKRPAVARPAKAERAERGEKKAKAAVDLPEEAVPLFEALRAWRAEQAREQGVPAYVIFHDATLREIAATRPDSVAQLSGIGGVGEKKLATYGEGVLALVSQDQGAGGVPPTDGAGDGAGAEDSAGAGAGGGGRARAQAGPDHAELDWSQEPEPEPGEADDWGMGQD